MLRPTMTLFVLLLSCSLQTARAEVTASAPDGFEIQHEVSVPLSKTDTWDRLLNPALWWNSDHTYSGDAANMKWTDDLWVEAFDGSLVTHGTSLIVLKENRLLIDTALGPLSDLGVTGRLSFTLSETNSAQHTKVALVYRVSGSSLSKLDEIWAGPVDKVLGEQMKGLAKLD